jgi:ABC-type glycerol-3-phosphate transport system substrate-binding protein
MDGQLYSQNQSQIPNQQHINASRKSSKLDIFKNKKVLMLGGLVILLIIVLVATAFAFLKPKKKILPPAAVTIQFWGKSIDEPVMSEIISEFESQNPLIKVKYIQESETDYKSRLQTRLSLKNPVALPDIVEVDEPWVDEIATELYPIQDPQIFSRFTNQMLNNNKLSGTTFGLPFNFDSLVLAYNKNQMAEQGYTESDLNKLDWSLLASRAKQVTKTKTVKTGNIETVEIERAGMAVGNPKTVKNADKILQLLLLENDAKIYDEKAKQYVIGGKFESVTTFYSKFALDNIWDDSLGSDIDAFSKEKVSMVLVRAQDIKTIQNANPNLQFVTVLPPIISAVKNVSLSTSLALPKARPNYVQSVKFLEYLSRPEVAYKLHESQKDNVFIPSTVGALAKIPQESHYYVFNNISPTVEKFTTSNYDLASKAIKDFLTTSYSNFNKKVQNPRFNFGYSSLESKLNEINKK